VSGNAVFAEYFVSHEATFVFGLRADLGEPEVVEVSLTLADLRDFVAAELGSTGANGGGAEPARSRLDRANLGSWQELLDPLVAPLGEWCAEGDPVWLVPHDVLHYLPLHALRVGGSLLLERNPVVYTPSASVMRYCRQKRQRPRGAAALVLGDSLGDLPFARDEAEAVAAALGTNALVGADATRTAFLDRMGDSPPAGVVHLACHGTFDAAEPLRSGIVLAPDHGGAEILSAEDIFGLTLSADLVVLSACESGVNARRPGDELLGLTRALVYAGVPSVVVSLWRVDDLSTLILMDRFYRGLAELHKARALQRAATELMQMTDDQVLEYVERRAAALRASGDDAAAERFEGLAYSSLLAAERRIPRPSEGPWRPFSHFAAWAPFVLVGDWR